MNVPTIVMVYYGTWNNSTSWNCLKFENKNVFVLTVLLLVSDSLWRSGEEGGMELDFIAYFADTSYENEVELLFAESSSSMEDLSHWDRSSQTIVSTKKQNQKIDIII